MAIIPYDRITNLQNDQALAPTDPYPAPKLDQEYNAVKITTDDIIQHLDIIQRDDGQLENESVGRDQLKDDVYIGFGAPAPWHTGHDYVVADTVFQDNAFWYCEVTHTSTNFPDDLAAGYWSLIADFTSAATVGSAMYISDFPPTLPTQGQQWFETDTGNTYVYYDDGSSAQWVHTNGSAAVESSFFQVGTAAVTRTMQDKVRESFSVKDFGAKGDARQLVGTTTVSGSTLTMAAASFTTADIGKYISVSGAGTAGGVYVTIIAGWVAPEQIILFAPAPTPLAGVNATVTYGTNDSVALTAAFTALNAEPAVNKLVFPSGGYISTVPQRISKSNVSIDCSGATIYYETAAGSAIEVFHPSAKVMDVSFLNLSITSSIVRDVGTNGLACLNVEAIRITGAKITKQHIAIGIGTFAYVRVEASELRDNTIGIHQNFGDGLFVGDTRIDTTPPSGIFTLGSIGVLIQAGGGTVISNCDVTNMQWGIRIAPTGSEQCNFIFLSACLCDSCETGLHAVAAGSAQISHIQIDPSCWFASNTNTGMRLEGVKILNASGASFSVNGFYGLVAVNCRELSFGNCSFNYNNTSNSAGGGGMLFNTCVGFRVQGCNFLNEPGLYSFAVPNMKIGITVDTGCNRYRVQDNNFNNLITSDLSIAAAPTEAVIFGNRTTRSNVIASAANISPDLIFDSIEITGSVDCQNILTPPVPGKEFLFRVQSACNIQDTFNFNLAGNFVGTAGSHLRVRAAGAQWVELSRAII